MPMRTSTTCRFVCRGPQQRKTQPAVDEWEKADQEPAYREHIRAPRITMHKSWDVDMFRSQVYNFVAEAYAEDQHDFGDLNMIIVRAMREAAHQQRAPREVTRREEVRGLAEAVRARNEEPNCEKRKVLSREIAKRRQRGGRQRAVRSALRPRRERGGAARRLAALRDCDGRPLAAPREVFEALHNSQSRSGVAAATVARR